jgi:hypothetical protein|tara:strand:+ start:43 stop:186 length:144 start_codon:yes stop_codon:yes gene_type:complete
MENLQLQLLERIAKSLEEIVRLKELELRFGHGWPGWQKPHKKVEDGK